MANIKNKQQEAMATIDTAKAMVDKVLTIMEIMISSPSVSLTFATNPIGFILQLLKHLGVTYEELRDYLANFLVYIIPVLEISVKTILLTNLKNMISCSVDPRIPEKYRKRFNCGAPYIENYGINIGLEAIDFLDKLSENPLSDFGKDMYFGLEGVDDVYKFARAEDMDAFLWFVMHKGKFPNAATASLNGSSFSDSVHGAGNYTMTPTNGTLLDVINLTSSASSPSKIMLGNTFSYEGSPNVISMCIDRQYDKDNNVVANTLVPVSDDVCSVNWYIRRADQLTKNLGFGKKSFEGRDFSKERAICNLQFIDTASSNLFPAKGLVNNAFRFTILPKPFIHIPSLTWQGTTTNLAPGEKVWGFVPLLFDSDGSYNPMGKYTIKGESTATYEGDYKVEKVDVTNDKGKTEKKNKITDTREVVYTVGEGKVKISAKTGKVTVDNKEKIRSGLVECYKGLTVYEFNYDFVMGMKLFDAKVMATTLLDTLVNTRLGLNLNLAKKHEEATEEIKEIIKNIINSDDSTVEDCYFSFDNRKYEELLRKSEEKRASQYNFGNTTNTSATFEEVYNILEEYDNAGTLEEQVDVINRAITQASVTITDGLDEQDKYGVEFNFVFDLIENLVLAIVNAVLTPKVLLLLEVNRQIMGGNWRAFTIKDLLRSMQGLIIALIREVRDLVIQELLKFVLKQLEPLKEMIESIILREQIENYTEAINDIIRNCPVIWFTFGNQNQETKLDTVDYADIDVSSNKADDKPTNNC